MVGVPRSGGCSLCVTRRVRCDQARPACGNCIKYKADCPGYDRGFKFVAGKHVVKQRGGSSKRPAKLCPGSVSTVPEAQHPPESTASGAGRVVARVDRFQPALSQTGICTTPRGDRSLVISTLIDNVRKAHPPSEVVTFGTWFNGILGCLGSKPLLDMSTCAFTLHLLGKKEKDEIIIAQSRALYGQCLGALQKALNHPSEWKTPETLCSTTLLCLYELFAGTSRPDSWMQHAAGVSHLMKLRGPKGHRTQWEKSILLSFRSPIVMNALFTGKDCFLAEPQWKGVARHCAATDAPIQNTIYNDNVVIVDDYFELLAKLPTILRHGYPLRDLNQRGIKVDVAKVLLLVSLTEKVRNEFETWFSTIQTVNPPPVEVPTKDPESIYPMVLEYTNPWIGSLYMGYWSSMLILQETLIQCQYPVDYAESNQLFMLNVMRSIETVGEGIMGPYRCGYPLRVAYEFSDPGTQAWCRMWLGRFEEVYAATSAKDYPK